MDDLDIIRARATRDDSRKLRERARELCRLLELRRDQLLLARAELASTKMEKIIRNRQVKGQP
ncbi:hypothetical protein [Bradyrhizobium sp. WSM1253]|uniref:hypothetical protein n=1 Tax=Bradyrhizobium sp. WSM1253 TaxID=319003 RepID=UPI00056A6EE4|nr:hypothetical protein [Bradyrhizobium sp. WSM1253]